MSTLPGKIKHEFMKALLPTLFFFFIIHVVADMLPFIDRFPDKPLIWNAAWKTLMYAVVALVVHYLERLYDYWKDTSTLLAANHAPVTKINWPRFWAIQILLVTLILMYAFIAELARVIGRPKLKAMFFGPLAAPPD